MSCFTFLSPDLSRLRHSPQAKSLREQRKVQVLRHSPQAKSLREQRKVQVLRHSPQAKSLIRNKGEYKYYVTEYVSCFMSFPPDQAHFPIKQKTSYMSQCARV